MNKVPLACQGVKCMRNGCVNFASHKVGEYNIWDEEQQPEQYAEFQSRHESTTYLCDAHFDQLMDRDEFYSQIDSRFH